MIIRYVCYDGIRMRVDYNIIPHPTEIGVCDHSNEQTLNALLSVLVLPGLRGDSCILVYFIPIFHVSREMEAHVVADDNKRMVYFCIKHCEKVPFPMA